MRGGQVWSQKIPLDGKAPPPKAPAPEGASSDDLDGVPPIDNVPASSPVLPSLTPPAVDDFFQQRPQAWWIERGPGLRGERCPPGALVLGVLAPLPVALFPRETPSSSRPRLRLGRPRP